MDLPEQMDWELGPTEPPGFLDEVKRYVHNGHTACRNRALVEAVARAVLAGVSARRVARVFKVSPKTVRNIVAHCEETGKLAPLKQRLAADLMEVASLAKENMAEALLAGSVPANVLPIMVGVSVEKAQLLTGSATSIVETKKGPTLEDLNRAIEQLPAIEVHAERTVDDHSTEPAPNPKEIDGSNPIAPSDARNLDPQAPAAEGEGGGVGERAAAGDAHWSQLAKFSPKGT